jgi:hypothetical protein
MSVNIVTFSLPGIGPVGSLPHELRLWQITTDEVTIHDSPKDRHAQYAFHRRFMQYRGQPIKASPEIRERDGQRHSLAGFGRIPIGYSRAIRGSIT